MPPNVTEIGEQVFASCRSLTDIEIPDKVTTIGDDAFRDCSDDLTIYGYSGTVAEEYANESGIDFEELS